MAAAPLPPTVRFSWEPVVGRGLPPPAKMTDRPRRRCLTRLTFRFAACPNEQRIQSEEAIGIGGRPPAASHLVRSCGTWRNSAARASERRERPGDAKMRSPASGAFRR